MFHLKIKSLLAALVVGCTTMSLNAQMAQDPLLSRRTSVESNIVFIFDASGSMDEQAIYQYGGTPGGLGMTGPGATTGNNNGNGGGGGNQLTTNSFAVNSPDVNLLAYDPRVLYSRRINSDGSFMAAGNPGTVSPFNVYFYKALPVIVGSVTVNSGGSAYPASGVTATFSPPSGVAGTTATGNGTTGQVSTGKVASVTINNPGTGYSNGTSVRFDNGNAPAGGTIAKANPVFASTNVVTGVAINNGGSGYPIGATGVGFDAPSMPGGTRATGTVTVGLTGKIASVTVTAAGTGYLASNAVRFSNPGGGGTRATGTLAVTAGKITGINITNFGSGYTAAPTMTITTAAGNGFAGTVNLDTGVIGFTLTNPGAGYTTAPTVSVYGGTGPTSVGSGAQLTATIGSRNVLTGIIITDPGSGYTSPPAVTLNGGGGSGVSLTAVMATTIGVTGVSVTSAGSGYAEAATVSLGNVGSGAGATFTVNMVADPDTTKQPVNKKWSGADTPTTASFYYDPFIPPSDQLAADANPTTIGYPVAASSAKTDYPKFKNRLDCAGKTCTWADEKQNYANWLLYHHSRLDIAKTGLGLAFQPLNATFRLGYGTIDQIANSSVLQAGVKTYNSTVQANFMTWLYGMTTNGSTPNRQAVDNVGTYYKRADDNGPWGDDPNGNTALTSTATANKLHVNCRRSYAMLMTDGYYNDTNFSIADYDSGAASVGPYSDGTTAVANTFADVAMKYWNTDLRPDLLNKIDISKTPNDQAYWQHMSFYGIGLGLIGTLDKDNPAVVAGLKGSSPDRTINWPAPVSNGPTTIDDMWHATINGRGNMLNAKSADDLRTSIGQMMSAITGDTGKQAGIAVSTASLQANTKKYTPSFTPIAWSGNLQAFGLDAATAAQGTIPIWQVETEIKANDGTVIGYKSLIPLEADRKIYVGNGATSSARAVEFKYASMSGLTGQMNGTVNDNLIKYLRGDTSNEQDLKVPSKANGIYRGREGRMLGDIVNSTPVFVKDSLNLKYGSVPAGNGTNAASTYASFLTAKSSRPEGVLVVGANDGMLHVFRDGTYETNTNTPKTPGGYETFAYVPNALLPTLNQLANKNYVHRYYVDGPNVETDAYFKSGTPHWANIVLGSTGAGAGVVASPGVSPRTAVFAIDTTSLNTNPTSMDASSVLWEVGSTNTDFSELGYVLTDIQSGPTLDGSWVAIFGNGYESKSCKASLFVVNLETGAKITEIKTDTSTVNTCTAAAKNGLGGVKIVRNKEQQIIGAYAGDLQGNLWKFNLNNASSSAWGLDLSSQPLFTAVDAANKRQPITAPPVVITLSTTSNPSPGTMVVIGTGKFYETVDIASTDPQSLYGIWDAVQFGVVPTTAAITKSMLGTQTISTAANLATGTNYFTVSTNVIDYIGKTTPSVVAAKRGWTIDLPVSGQRMVYPLDVLQNRFVAVDTIAPAAGVVDACNRDGSGLGYRYFLDALSGSGPVAQIFDTNGLDGVTSVDTIYGGYETKADGRNVILQVDPEHYRDCSGTSLTCNEIKLDCSARGDCAKPGSKVKTREWRQLFMR
jgi:type IV pilus assembly protein PilY1